MPTLAHNKTARRNRRVTAPELREFTKDRTAKYVASVLNRDPHTVRNMAKRYRLPLAVERQRGGSK